MTLPVRVFLSRSSHLGAATKASSSFSFLKKALEALFSETAITSRHTKFQKPAFHGLAYLRPHFLRFRDTPEKTPKASLVPYVPKPILLYVFHYGEVVPEPSSATQISLVSYTFLSIYIYVYVLSYILRFSVNVPFIVSYFFIWCFGYPHSRIPYMALVSGS